MIATKDLIDGLGEADGPITVETSIRIAAITAAALIAIAERLERLCWLIEGQNEWERECRS